MELVPWVELSEAIQTGLIGLGLMVAAVPLAWMGMLFLDFDYFNDSEPARQVGWAFVHIALWVGLTGGLFVFLAFVIERVVPS